MGDRIAPIRSNRSRWAEHKRAAAKFWVRNGEGTVAPSPAIPQHYIKIERAGAPALAHALAAKAALDLLKQREQRARAMLASDHGGAIGIAPMRGAERRAVDDRRDCLNLQTRRLKRDQRGAQDAARGAKADMALV